MAKLTNVTNKCFKSVRHQIAQEIEMIIYAIGQDNKETADMFTKSVINMLGGTEEAEYDVLKLAGLVKDMLDAHDDSLIEEGYITVD